MRTIRALSGLLIATLFVPLAAFTESDTDRAKREMTAFCTMVPLYCKTLSKAQKQAMLTRFLNPTTAQPPPEVPPPYIGTTHHDRAEWPAGDSRLGDCLRAQHRNPYSKTITQEEAQWITNCARRPRGAPISP